MPTLSDEIRQLSQTYTDETISIRRAIHANPELSFDEHDTTALIIDKLSGWGIDCRKAPSGTGVLATIEGREPNQKCVALRADIDALPIDERNECAYKSQKAGVMHACGHDAHTAMLLSAARILHEMKDKLYGTAKFIFQPAEEKIPGGAKSIIESGFTDDVDLLVGMHVYPDLPCGEVGFCKGAYMASCDEIEITLNGKGGHAAKPSERDDMVLIASELIVQLQKINGRLKPKNIPTILAFGAMNANGTYNVIPDKVTIKGTFRTFDENWRMVAKRIIRETVSNIAVANRIKAEVKINDGYPYLLNDNDLTDTCQDLATQYLGTDNVKEIGRLLTSEDFAWYTHRIPSCFFRLGTSNAEKGITSKQHTPTFDIDEDALRTGVGLMAWTAANLLTND